MPNFPHLFAWRKIAALDAKFVKIRMVKIRPPTTHTAYGKFCRIPKKEQQKVGLTELLVTSVSTDRIALTFEPGITISVNGFQRFTASEMRWPGVKGAPRRTPPEGDQRTIPTCATPLPYCGTQLML